MSKATLVLFAATVGLSLLSLHLVKQMRGSQATIAELQSQVAAFERQQQQVPPSVVEAPVSTFLPEPAAPAPAPAPAKEKPKPAAVMAFGAAAVESSSRGMPSAEERMRMFREARQRQRQLMQDPEYREALRLQHRTNMSRNYPGLADDLRLTPEQTEQLFDLLADQQLRNDDHMEPIWDGENNDPAAMQQRAEQTRQKWAETQRQNEAELAALLGPQKMHAWKEYQSTLGARHQAEHLRSTLASQGLPLGQDATRAVVKALAEVQRAEMQEYASEARIAGTSASASTWSVAMVAPHSPAAAGGPGGDPYERQLEMSKKRNQRVIDALSPYLTYEQLEAVRKEHEAQIKMQEAHNRVMRAQSKSDGNAAGRRLEVVTHPATGGFTELVPLQ